MKITKILICFMVLAPWNLQADFFSWLSPKQWNIKQPVFSWTFWKPKPSLDAMTEDIIKNYEQSRFTSPYINSPQKKIIHTIRQEQAQEAFIDTLLRSTIELQNNPDLKGKNKKIIEQATKKANKAHHQTFVAVDKKHQLARATAQKAYEKIKTKKEADEQQVIDSLTQMIFMEVFKQRQKEQQLKAATTSKEYQSVGTQTELDASNFIMEDESPGYTVFPNIQTRLQKKIHFNQSNPICIGGKNKPVVKQELLAARLARFEQPKN